MHLYRHISKSKYNRELLTLEEGALSRRGLYGTRYQNNGDSYENRSSS